jgi:hypothetical protein
MKVKSLSSSSTVFAITWPRLLCQKRHYNTTLDLFEDLYCRQRLVSEYSGGLDACKATITHWIEFCSSTHPECRTVNYNEGAIDVTMRVIDSGAVGDSSIGQNDGLPSFF